MAAILQIPFETGPYEIGPDQFGDRNRHGVHTVLPFDLDRKGSRRIVSRRIGRQRQLGVVVVMAMLAVVTVFGLGVVFAVIDATSQPPTATPVALPSGPVAGADAGAVIVVQSGDTLTSIARRIQPTGEVNGLVDRLAALHGPAPLQAGERLAVGSLGSVPGQAR